MKYREDTGVLFELIDLVSETSIMEEFKKTDKLSAIDLFLLLKKNNVLKKAIKILTGEDPKGLAIVDFVKVFKHYSKLYQEVKKEFGTNA